MVTSPVGVGTEAEEIGHGPKCIVVGWVLKQSRRHIHSLLILEELNTRKKSTVYLCLFQDVHIFVATKRWK